MQRDGVGNPVRVWYHTDKLLMPPLGVNCVLAVVQALLGKTWAQLGVAADKWLKHKQELVNYADLAGLVARALRIGSPLGGLTLPRFRIAAFELLRLKAGVVLGGANIRQNDTLHPHAWGEAQPRPYAHTCIQAHLHVRTLSATPTHTHRPTACRFQCPCRPLFRQPLCRCGDGGRS